MLEKNPLIRYWRLMEGHEKRVVIVYPFIIAAVLTWAAYEGDTESCVDYCVDVVPVVASIFIGFLGTMIVASLSKDGVFERMRSTEAEGNAKGRSAYHLFFTGICANFYFGMALLLITLVIGLINDSFELDFDRTFLQNR